MTATGEPETYLTDEVKALIGQESEWSDWSEPYMEEALRRVTQATMDNDRAYWDEEYARASKYKGIVCPPLFVTQTNRRKIGTPDPFDWYRQNPEWDGAAGGSPATAPEAGANRAELPPLRTPLVRVLNAGTEAEFFQYVRPGQRVRFKRRWANIVERQGRDGKMLITTTETIYENEQGEVVAIIRSSGFRR